MEIQQQFCPGANYAIFRKPGNQNPVVYKVSELELEFRRDERVMRYLTVKLDKHAKAWADKRKKRNSVKTK